LCTKYTVVHRLAKSPFKVRLVIWCSPETRRRFKVFAAKNDLSYEEALLKLLDHYEKTRLLDVEVFGPEREV